MTLYFTIICDWSAFEQRFHIAFGLVDLFRMHFTTIAFEFHKVQLKLYSNMTKAANSFFAIENSTMYFIDTLYTFVCKIFETIFSSAKIILETFFYRAKKLCMHHWFCIVFGALMFIYLFRNIRLNWNIFKLVCL